MIEHAHLDPAHGSATKSATGVPEPRCPGRRPKPKRAAGSGPKQSLLSRYWKPLLGLAGAAVLALVTGIGQNIGNAAGGLLVALVNPSHGPTATALPTSPSAAASAPLASTPDGSTASGPSTTPDPSRSADHGCPNDSFEGWGQIIPRRTSGSYAVPLGPCELLWFNSGSVLLEQQRLGGEVADQNTVLLYRASTATTIHVAVGDPQDLGHEWLARAHAGFDATVAAWAVEALGGANCQHSCASLRLFEVLDGVRVGDNIVTSALASGPCAAVPVGALTALRTELWQLGGGYLQVEFYAGSEPERETILPLDASTSGWRVLAPLKGYVWSYSATCTMQEVRDSVEVHVADRIQNGYRNDGFVDWGPTRLFEPIAAK